MKNIVDAPMRNIMDVQEECQIFMDAHEEIILCSVAILISSSKVGLLSPFLLFKYLSQQPKTHNIQPQSTT